MVNSRPDKFPSILWLILLLFLLLGLSGCAVGHPSPSFTSTPTTEFVLAPGTYEVVGRLEGHASCPFLFWVDMPDTWLQFRYGFTVPLISFALGDTDLRTRAMADLHSKVEIQGTRRVLHNIMEETTIANYLGLFAILEVTVSAEVIEFTGGQS
ncbi:MAG: hypothetical protein JSU59_01755 [Nitrospirota bacterium]|nr:MAG: hypothetical protein JSU59_01755 [Nitrospirota bacterium]